MAGVTRVLSFAEGVSVSAPTQSSIQATSLADYADDAAFVTAKGSAAETGDMYYNTTDNLIHYYDDAGVWRSVEAEKNNYAGTSTPTVNDDSSAGYSVGSKYIDITNDKAYVCVDASVGAAVWNLSGGSAGSANDWVAGFANNYIVDADYNIDYDVLSNITSIEGRAPIRDCENTVYCSMGVERIHFLTINRLADEYAASYLPVYEIDTQDPRIRIIGSKVTQSSTNNGDAISIPTNAWMEVTFWGTGLNLLNQMNSTATRGIQIIVDGGTLGANLYVTGYTHLNSRGVDAHNTVNLVSGLTEGWHTIAIVSTAASSLNVFGVEIINEVTSISYQTGNGFEKTVAEIITAEGTSAYNAGVSGTRGARVIKYLSGNAISQVVQEVEASASYLVNADHTNEEMYSKIEVDSMGVNIGDDFKDGSATTVDRRFISDDGGTCLVGDDVLKAANNTTGWQLVAAGDSLRFEFYGTGLDIYTYGAGNESGGTIDVYIDSNAAPIGSLQLGVSGFFRLEKIVSGLPCGWHVVQFLASAGLTSYTHFIQFRAYRPKKPVVPATAIPLIDYDVLADHSAVTDADNINISQGIIRESFIKYAQYAGTGWAISGFAETTCSYASISSTTNGDSVKKYFYGTGFELRYQGNTNRSASVSLSLNGSSDFSSYTISTWGAGTGFTAGTGVLDQAAGANTPGCGLSVSGLPLGFYTLVQTNNTTDVFQLEAIDIITPIYHPGGRELGGTSYNDIRKFTPIEDSIKDIVISEAKAYLVSYLGGITYTSKNIAAVTYVGTGNFIVHFKTPFKTYPVVAGITQSNNTIGISAYYSSGQDVYDSVEFTNFNSTPAAADSVTASLVFFGTLLGE